MTFNVIAIHSFGSCNKSLSADSLSIPWFLKVAPFFDMTKINGISPTCQRDFYSFLSAMDRLELWALKSDFLASKKKIPKNLLIKNYDF